MTAAVFLDRLRKVKTTGEGTWVACCPAHDDKSPSLAVRELGDGTVLAHCFAGCGIDAILSAVGLEVGDLFARPLRHHLAPVAQPRFPVRDVLECVAKEVTVVAICAHALRKGGSLQSADVERLNMAHARIQEAINVIR